MKKIISLLTLSFLFSSTASALNWYADAGFGFISFDDGTNKVSPTNIYLRGGYQLNKYFNFGLETSYTISDDSSSAAPGVDFESDIVTLYFRGGFPVHRKVWLFGQLGHAQTKLTQKSSGGSDTNSNTDLMYGIGAEIYPWKKPAYVSLGYTSYNNNGDAEVTAFTLGMGYRF